MKHCLLLVGLLFAFTSCTTDTTSKVETETALNNTKKNIQTKEISSNTMEPTHETPTPMVNTTVQPEDASVENSNPYGFFYDISNPYKEYINNLKYLDDLDAKILIATTTVDMAAANENALNAWDKELNKIYALLLDKLSTEDIEKLKSEERLWIKGKEEKANAIESLGGSQAAADANGFLFMETKQRTLELIHRYYSHNHDVNRAMEAYRAVLQSEAQFFDVEDNKDDYLESSFFNDGDTERAKLYFAVIDMDEDGISEVVVKGIYESGNVAMSRILHYEDGTVYSYFFGARELDDLKKDGSFSWSGGSRYSGDSHVQFFGVYLKETFLANYYVEDVSALEKYFIDNVSVTEDEFNTYCNNQNEKNDVIWYELNKDNIISQVVTYPDKPDLAFADLANMAFTFSSGAGAWSTEVNFSADGAFSGLHHDSDAGDIGTDYPNGTRYYCNFSGKFSSLKKIDNYTYSMKCISITQEGQEGDIEIGEEDGVRYIVSNPYGFDDADEFILYLPGKKISELPEDYLAWVCPPLGINTKNISEIDFYGLYNVAGKQGFWGG